MVVKVFIDTNVLVRYLFYLFAERRRKTPEAKAEIWEIYGEKVKSSYVFILNLVKLGNKKVEFIVSDLVFSELYNTLCDEAICKQMWEDGVPLNSWTKFKDKFSRYFGDIEKKEIKKAVKELREEKNLERVEDYCDLDLISELIVDCGIKTQDSILLSTSLKKGCKFFITADEQDFHNNNKLKDKCCDKIEFLTPQEAIKKFFPPKK